MLKSETDNQTNFFFGNLIVSNRLIPKEPDVAKPPFQYIKPLASFLWLQDPTLATPGLAPAAE